MTIDELVEELSFGKSSEKVSSCLGMYLSPEVIYIAETHLEKGKLAVDHLVRIPVPPPPPEKGKEAGKDAAAPATVTLTTDFVFDQAKLGALIRESMAQFRWNSKDVLVTLSHHLGLLRYFTMPALERSFWKTAIPMEAKKYIPIPFEGLSYDYQILPLPPEANRARQGSLIAVTNRKNVDNVENLLRSLDLKTVGIEVAPCSVLRVWEHLNKETRGQSYGHVHFDGGNVRIMVADKGMPVFFRELFLGADATLREQKKVDLGGCIAFAQKQLAAGQLTQVRLSGANNAISGWQEAFAAEAGVPATVEDTAGQLGIKGGDWGGFAAIGASARFLASTTMTLDLARIGKISEEESRAAKDILMISGLVALVILGAGLMRESLYRVRARELSKYRPEPDIEVVFAGKRAIDIEGLLKDMQNQADVVRGVGVVPVRISAVLKDVVDALPEKAWLTQVQITNPLLKDTAVQLEMSLAGHCVGATLGQEQDLAFEFKERLLKSPVVGKLFPEIQVSVAGKPLSKEKSEGLDPAALADQLEQRTFFTVTGKAQKRS